MGKGGPALNFDLQPNPSPDLIQLVKARLNSSSLGKTIFNSLAIAWSTLILNCHYQLGPKISHLIHGYRSSQIRPPPKISQLRRCDRGQNNRGPAVECNFRLVPEQTFGVLVVFGLVSSRVREFMASGYRPKNMTWHPSCEFCRKSVWYHEKTWTIDGHMNSLTVSFQFRIWVFEQGG